MTANGNRVATGFVDSPARLSRAVQRNSKIPMQPKQLRRLHLLWRRWTARLALSRDADRQLRHYFIWIITAHECPETRSLSAAQAARVIDWLWRQVRKSGLRENHIAGIAGRRGYPEYRKLPPNDSSWRALWRCAASLGMDRGALDRFIRRHYGRQGLRGVADLHTMAELNRVLWGLKAALRHRGKSADCPTAQWRAA